MDINSLLPQIKLPTYTPAKKSAVSVYIGPEKIELAYLKRISGKISVVKAVSRDISHEKGSLAERKMKIPSILREIFETEEIKETQIITTLPEESIMLRRFTMPLIPAKDRQTAVMFEAKKHIPFNINEITSGFSILNENRVLNKMEILFVAVKREEVNCIHEIFNAADLDIEKIEPMSLALINSLLVSGNLQKDAPPTTIIYFTTHDKAQIIIVENAVPFLKREVSLLAREDKAEERIRNELRLSANYYKREFPEKNINKVIICGLTETPSWISSLSTSLSIPVEQAKPLATLNGSDFPTPQLEIALGLASRRLTRPKLDINLLPKELVPIKYNVLKIATAEIGIAIVVLLLVSLAHIPGAMKWKKKLALAQKEKLEYPNLDLSKKPTEELKQINSDWQNKKDIIQKFTKDRINWHQKLQRLSNIMPQEAWLTELSLSDSFPAKQTAKMSIKGYTYSKETIKEIEITNNFFKKLKSDSIFMNKFNKSNLGTMNKNSILGYEVIDFDITVES